MAKRERGNGVQRSIGGEVVSRYAVELNQEQRARYREVARSHGKDLKGLLLLMLDVFSLPDKGRGQRLCICDGERDSKPQLIAGL